MGIDYYNRNYNAWFIHHRNQFNIPQLSESQMQHQPDSHYLLT